MSELFLKLFNMSLTASWLIGAVILLRFVFKKAPKWVLCLLWALVAVRLILPFSFESRVSLVPSAEVLPQSSILSHTPSVDTGIPAVNEAINPVITETLSPDPGDSANPLQVLLAVGSTVWIAGVCIMLLYSLISWLRIQKRVQVRLRLRENIYFSDRIDTPFILGIIKPKIYIPSSLPREQLPLIIAHEQAHLKRLDHLWKPLGFALLAVYWFNPLVWVAYILLCRDIEQACDEKVIKNMDVDARADYSEALLECSIHRSAILACPLAFGEVGVKDRIKAVLNYRKPALWIISAAVLAAAITAVCFLSNPISMTHQLEAIKKATTARELLMQSVGSHSYSNKMPSYMLGRYIGEDYKLYIRMNESGREQESSLREALGEYADIVVFEYSDMTAVKLNSHAGDIQAALTDRGFDVSSVRVAERSGNIIVIMTDEKDVAAALAAVKPLQKYSFGIEVTDKSVFDYYKAIPERDLSDSKYLWSIRASEYLMMRFYRKGYISDYPEYYAGSYIGEDNLYHIVLNKSVRTAKEDIDEMLGRYSDDVVYEYADYSRNELLEYMTDISMAMDDLGICTAGSSVSEFDGTVTIQTLWEDMHLAEKLIRRWNPFPFGHTDISVEISYGNLMVAE